MAASADIIMIGARSSSDYQRGYGVPPLVREIVSYPPNTDLNLYQTEWVQLLWHIVTLHSIAIEFVRRRGATVRGIFQSLPMVQSRQSESTVAGLRRIQTTKIRLRRETYIADRGEENYALAEQ